MQRVKLNGEANWEISIERISILFSRTHHFAPLVSPSVSTFDAATRCHATSYDELLSPVCNFVQVFRWRAVKSGTDDDSFKTRYKPSGNGLSTIIVDPLKHLLDACSHGFDRERESDVFYSHLLTADISISVCKLLSGLFSRLNRIREGDPSIEPPPDGRVS